MSDMIRWDHPQLLYLLYGIPLLVLIIWWEYRWRTAAVARWADEALWSTVLPYHAPRRNLLKRSLVVAAIALLIVTVSGPQVGTRLAEMTREGTDIVLCVDLSNSMLAEDLTPSRIVKTRHEIGRFLAMLRGDRVALVPFAGVAFVQVPMTLDYSAVMSLMGALEPGIIPQGGTSFKEAINQAVKAFPVSSDPDKPVSQAQKIIVLITDGEDQDDEAVNAAKEAAKKGIIIYTVGMATANGKPIPEKDASGQIVGYKKDSQGGTIISKLNDDLLKDIASATGGKYFNQTPTGDEFKRLFNEIQGHDKEKYEALQYTDFEDRFQWTLALALLLMIVAEIIPAGRRKKDEA